MSEQYAAVDARYRKNMTLDATNQKIGKTREMVRQLESKVLRKFKLSRITKQIEEKFEVNYSHCYHGS